MRSSSWLIVLGLFMAGGMTGFGRAQDAVDAHWIWLDASESGAKRAWFRREVYMSGPCTGAAYVAADDGFTIWVNGQKVGQGEGAKSYRFNLNGIVERGINVIAVEVVNQEGKAGLIVEGEIRRQDGHRVSFDSSADWKATSAAPQGDDWLKPRFDDSAWLPARDLGKHADSAWKEIVFDRGFYERFSLAPGFKLRRVAESELCGSVVAITWGNRARLLVSAERGPVYSLVDRDGDGAYDAKSVYTEQVTNCQGLCMVGNDLYVVGNGPRGTGLYKLPDRNQDDKADEVVLLLAHKGNMGEHGPHDVVVGPDGWLYHNLGNHSWVPHAGEPDSPVGAYYEGDLLQPRFEDAGGHAVGIKAPGGTVWRFSPDGKKWWLHTAGFRNHYDIAFNQYGDLFTFDSDMEWDVGMPWYRPVRVNHCTAGAQFGWRSGAAKGPEYLFDTLPGNVNVGRGSPTGVVFYEHRQFPEKYQGTLLCCDWSMGRILAVRLREQGASYGGSYETLVAGNPLNVSDIEVDRDGSVVFSTGGRGTEGGIYRLTYGDGAKPTWAANVADLLKLPQSTSNWAREDARTVRQAAGEAWERELARAVRFADTPEERVRALTLLAQLGPRPDLELLLAASQDKAPAVRRAATSLLGEHAGEKVARRLVELLDDNDAHVQRRACEALLRGGTQPPPEALLRLLASDDRWLRYAARLTLERLPADAWREPALSSANPTVATEALLALHRLDINVPEGKRLLTRDAALQRELALLNGKLDNRQTLNLLRMVQLTLQVGGGNSLEKLVAEKCAALLREHAAPSSAAYSKEVAVEAARVVAHLQHPRAIELLLGALEARPDDVQWQIHHALCLAYVQSPWTPEQRTRLFRWYESTRDWDGGDSFVGYIANFMTAIQQRFTPKDRREILLAWRQWPFAADVLLRRAGPENIADFDGAVAAIMEDLNKTPGDVAGDAILSAAIEALGKSQSAGAKQSLRKLFDQYADRGDVLARSLAARPDLDDVPYLLRSLRFGNRTTLQIVLQALGKLSWKPDKPDAYREVILAGMKLQNEGGLAATLLLARWTGDTSQREVPVAKALEHYQKWFAGKFPDEPPPTLQPVDPAKSRYTVDQLVRFLESSEGKAGDVVRGRQVFIKANCAKCHKFGSDGAGGVGPDLTAVRRRFQQREIVESVLAPSAVVSDQFRSITVQTSSGLVHTGLPLPQPGTRNLVLLLPDGTKIEIPPKEIEVREPSRLSVMPEGLLKDLSLVEIADLFAYLETSKSAAVSGGQGGQ